MADAPHTVSTLDAIFKEVYADKLEKLIPDYEELLKSIPFVKSSQKNGGSYNQPVLLSRDHGISYLGDDSVLTLNDAVPSIVKNAAVKGAGKVMKTQISHMSASRAKQGPRAFVDGIGFAVQSLMESFAASQEASHWYGDNGLAYFTAATADLSSDLVTITAEEFAPALWIGGEGMLIDIYSVTGTGLAKAPNALVLQTSIDKVDMINRRLELASVGGLSDSTEYVILRRGQKTYDSKGLLQILANSSSLFGIDAATYPLWQANQYSVGTAALSFAKVSNGISLAMGRGLRGPIELYVHSTVFEQMFPDFNTVKTGSSDADFPGRVFNAESDVKTLRHGVKTMEFIINGVEVMVKSSEYVKPRLGFGICTEDMSRVGSSPITAGMPGMEDERVFFELEGKAAVELRMFSDEALFCKAPSRSILFYGIDV